ncbi:MAG: Gfo/Idh/MocA family oxidoreductase, partial [Bacteroidota bacterium]
MKLRIGVVGCGHLGSLHTSMLAQIASADLVGVYDVEGGRAQRIAAEHGTRAFDSLESLLSGVQAVSIATTTKSHFEVARKALERGVHVFIEKPITEKISHAEELVKMAEAANLRIQVGH